MPVRQRAVITLSVPQKTADEYRKIAKAKGETISQFFREIFSFYKEEKLKNEFFDLQQYGAKKARDMMISEKDVDKIIFEGR